MQPNSKIWSTKLPGPEPRPWQLFNRPILRMFISSVTLFNVLLCGANEPNPMPGFQIVLLLRRSGATYCSLVLVLLSLCSDT